MTIPNLGMLFLSLFLLAFGISALIPVASILWAPMIVAVLAFLAGLFLLLKM